MDYYCEMGDKHIKLESKYRHFKSNTQKEFDKCEHIIITNENHNLNEVDRIFYSFITEHNKKFDYFLKKCHFKLVFIDYELCPYITSELSDTITMCYWYKFLENVFNVFKNKDYTLNLIEKRNIITFYKLDMSYEFFIAHNMCALEGN